MPVQSPEVNLPQGATPIARLELCAQANISAYVARQKVTRYVVMEISSQLLGDTPEFVVGERLCWSVPILLTSPTRGVVGRVGEIAVDSATGELLIDEDSVRRINDDARRLAERSPL